MGSKKKRCVFSSQCKGFGKRLFKMDGNSASFLGKLQLRNNGGVIRKNIPGGC